MSEQDVKQEKQDVKTAAADEKKPRTLDDAEAEQITGGLPDHRWSAQEPSAPPSS